MQERRLWGEGVKGGGYVHYGRHYAAKAEEELKSEPRGTGGLMPCTKYRRTLLERVTGHCRAKKLQVNVDIGV